ncbi:MAG: NfeD family protein [Kiritimatiellales bacterium]
MKAKIGWIVILFAAWSHFVFAAETKMTQTALPPAAEGKQLVYEIPIKEQISPSLLYIIRRGVTAAEKNHADAIVFVMDTPGGRVDVTREIIAIIRDIKTPVYTFIERDAYSAGAIIALATPNIYMAPGSVIGAATPMMMSPAGGAQDLNEEVSEKMKSAVAAMVRAAAEQGGHDPALAEAMVRREMEYSIGTNVVSKAGELLTLTASEAAGILSKGTVADVPALLTAAGMTGAEIVTLEVTGAEKLARIISVAAPILLMIGLGGIYLEIKTPGFGIFGIGGILALALFFFGHHIAGLSGMEDIVIFAVGVMLLLIEIFVTPGFGILGISGIALIILSLVTAMSWKMPGELLPAISGGGATLQTALINLAIAFAGLIIFAIAAAKWLPEARVIRPLMLGTDSEISGGAVRERTDLIGKEGIALTNLIPSGRIRISGNDVNVISRGEFIAKDTAVKITAVHGSRIIVEKI